MTFFEWCCLACQVRMQGANALGNTHKNIEPTPRTATDVAQLWRLCIVNRKWRSAIDGDGPMWTRFGGYAEGSRFADRRFFSRTH